MLKISADGRILLHRECATLSFAKRFKLVGVELFRGPLEIARIIWNLQVGDAGVLERVEILSMMGKSRIFIFPFKRVKLIVCCLVQYIIGLYIYLDVSHGRAQIRRLKLSNSLAVEYRERECSLRLDTVASSFKYFVSFSLEQILI